MEKALLVSLILIVFGVDFVAARVMPQISSVAMVLCFLLLYYWLLTLAMVHQKRMSLKHPKAQNTDYIPKVSVVIAAHNEEAVIADTVACMLAIDYPSFEVLVMDDRSGDQTPVILKRLAETLSEDVSCFRYHIRPADSFPGKSAVLNDALTLTDGEVICVFDADARVAPDFLKRIIGFLSDDNVGAVQARKIIANADFNTLTRVQNYEYSLDAYLQCGRESVYGAVELRGNGELIKREALLEVNGWNNNSITDDLDLSTRLHLAGWDIRFAHKVLVYEEGITIYAPLLKQRRRWSEGSVMRYIENASQIFQSRQVSIRVRFDMILYFIQTLMPVWLALDLTWLALEWIFFPATDIPKTRIISSLLVAPVVGGMTTSSLIIAIIRFNTRKDPHDKLQPRSVIHNIPHAIQWAGITGFYMILVWFPVNFAMFLKLLFQKDRTLDWDRTPHYGSQPVTEGA